MIILFLELVLIFTRISNQIHFSYIKRVVLTNISGKATLRGLNLTVSRSRGLTVKKVLYSFRNKLFTFLQITVPICLMWIGLTRVEDTAGFEKVFLIIRQNV